MALSFWGLFIVKWFEALILGMVTFMVSTGSCLGADDDDDQVSTLIVSGLGTASAEPDIVTVVLGVQTRDKSAAKAMADNAEQMTGTIAALKGAGVKEEDIKTSGFSIYPMRDWIDGKRSEEVIFEVNNQVTFTMDLCDEIDIGEVLDAAVGAGTNTVNSVNFGLKDTSSAQQEALSKAVADAMSKAETIAGAAGVNLGRIMSISENGFTPIPISTRLAFAEVASSSTPIVLGEVEVTASVSMTYEIE